MSDRDLRAIEREAAIGDGVASERLMRERLRTGSLSRDRVLAAAALGDAGATRVVGKVAPPLLLSELEVILNELGVEAIVRAGIAMARLCRESSDGRSTAIDRSIQACEAWVVDPQPETEVIAQHLSQGYFVYSNFWMNLPNGYGACLVGSSNVAESILQLLPGTKLDTSHSGTPFEFLSQGALFHAGERELPLGQVPPNFRDAISLKGEELSKLWVEKSRYEHALRAWWKPARRLGELRVVAEIRKEVVPWLLGGCDPVRERAPSGIELRSLREPAQREYRRRQTYRSMDSFLEHVGEPS